MPLDVKHATLSGLSNGGRVHRRAFQRRRDLGRRCAESVTRVAAHAQPTPFPTVQRIVLEMSPKPLLEMSEEGVRRVCGEAFRQWAPLVRHADAVAVMLWTADGSEILDYRGRRDDPIEWARYIGHPNPRKVIPRDRQKKSLQSGAYLYREKPAALTYGGLAMIVKTLKQVGSEMTGKPVQVGATFDPGGELRDRLSSTRGTMRFAWAAPWARAASSAATRNSTPTSGLTPAFPTAFPRARRSASSSAARASIFYRTWASITCGFPTGWASAWRPGRPSARYSTARRSTLGGRARSANKILQFWKLFRRECPRYPIETRGTNFSAGIDLASNGVPLRDIYGGGFNLEPPPNSPWGDLNGDFGLELVGYMTRVAELPPGKGFPFRYYLHDPWWLNSPWLDHYGREPHDIYLPLAVGRLGARGTVETPRSISLLTIDDSYGRMPEKCPNEIIPHILTALEHRPDCPGLTVWVYPFDEYQDMLSAARPRLEEPFFSDWFMRAAIDDGFPLNTIVTTKNFIASLRKEPKLYERSILVTSAPDAGSPMDGALIRRVEAGGRVLLYGPLDHASAGLLELLNLRLEEPIAGRLKLELHGTLDRLSGSTYATGMQHRLAMSAGGCREVLRHANDPTTQVIAMVSQGPNQRVAALARRLSAGKGEVAWVRGTNSASYVGGHLLTRDDPNRWFRGEALMRFALDGFGYRVALRKRSVGQPNPVTLIASHDNGWFFSGYTPDTNVELRLRFPLGAPVLTGLEPELVDGEACYHMPRAWHRECRVFVKQSAGEVTCQEQFSGANGMAPAFARRAERRHGLLLSGIERARQSHVAARSEIPVRRRAVSRLPNPQRCQRSVLDRRTRQRQTIDILVTYAALVVWGCGGL